MDNGTSVNGISEMVYYFEGKSQMHQYVMVIVFQEKQEIILIILYYNNLIISNY